MNMNPAIGEKPDYLSSEHDGSQFCQCAACRIKRDVKQTAAIHAARAKKERVESPRNKMKGAIGTGILFALFTNPNF